MYKDSVSHTCIKFAASARGRHVFVLKRTKYYAIWRFYRFVNELAPVKRGRPDACQVVLIKLAASARGRHVFVLKRTNYYAIWRSNKRYQREGKQSSRIQINEAFCVPVIFQWLLLKRLISMLNLSKLPRNYRAVVIRKDWHFKPTGESCAQSCSHLNIAVNIFNHAVSQFYPLTSYMRKATSILSYSAVIELLSFNNHKPFQHNIQFRSSPQSYQTDFSNLDKQASGISTNQVNQQQIARTSASNSPLYKCNLSSIEKQ